MKKIRLTMALKTLGLCTAFLLLLTTCLLYVMMHVARGTRVIDTQRVSLARLETANALAHDIAELRYWLTDLALSWQNESEEHVDAARAIAEQHLETLESTDPELVTDLRSAIDEFVSGMLPAVDAYIEENRVLGNSIVSEGRTRAAAILERVGGLLTAASTDSSNAGRTVAEGNTYIRNASFVVLAVSIQIGVVLALWFARSITRPIRVMVAQLKDLNLSKRLDTSRNDELGDMARSFNSFVHTLQATIAEIDASTEEIDNGSTQVSEASQGLAQGASDQAASLQEISSSLEEMSSMTQQNVENAKQAAGLSEESQKSANKGRQEMTMMSEAMDEIKKSAAEISKIIKVIDEIAFQTNLLALNAAVEAARAGEAGKGFAVVAEEVRNLAQRSAEAAKNTASMIEDSTQRADNGVSIAQRVGEALEEIVTSTHKVNTLLGEIASASQEQADGIGQINTGVSDLDQITQQNAGNAEELASASEETSSQVVEMRRLIARFKIEKGEEEALATATTAATASGTPASAPGKHHDPKVVIPMDDDEGFSSF